jgi:hypothetical protein
MHPLLPDEFDLSEAPSLSEGTILGLAVLGVIINLSLIVATVMLMPENSCQDRDRCNSHARMSAKYF